MSQPLIKGWCPGALRPMESGDGWVVRVRPHSARFSSEQATGFARLSRAYGNGLIDISARANIQLRGVQPETHAPLLEGLAELGLLDADERAEARRNLIVTPFWQRGDETEILANRMEVALNRAPDLPGKFGFAVDTGPAPVLRATSADIRVERTANGELLLRADGAEFGALVGLDDAPEQALALARWFLASGGAPAGRGRMAAHLRNGAMLPSQFAGTLLPAQAAPPPQPGACKHGVLISVAFGQIAAKTLMQLAALGNGVRVTPWRMLLLEGVSNKTALPADATLILSPDDPRLRVEACSGAPACPQAHQPTRALALSLAAHVPAGKLLHVSGCAKGCAHPGKADFTLTGGSHGYCLARNGSTTDTSGPAYSAAQLAADPTLLLERS